MEVSGRETSQAVFGTDFGGDSLSTMAVKSKEKTSNRSDPSIATRSIMLPKPLVEHIGSAKGRVINECIYLLI
jgi:hypothetical protein